MAEEENNSVDLSNLSLEHIEEMYADIVEYPYNLHQIAYVVPYCPGKWSFYCSGPENLVG